MKIKEIDIDLVVPYERNATVHPDDQIQELANGIQQFGFRQPILVDGNNVIITGHGRLLAAKLLGMKKVPVIVAEGLSDVQVKAYRIADNKMSKKSYFDEDLLALEISDLIDMSFDLEFTGFDDDEIDNLLGTESIIIVQKPEKQAEKKEKSVLDSQKKEKTTEILKELKKEDLVVVFQCEMTAEQKSEIISVLTSIKARNNIESTSDALLFLIRQFA